jgi:CBS domain-containing protein
LILSKLRTVEGLKNEDSGQFINLEELSKIDKEKLKCTCSMRELEELIKKVSTDFFPSYAGLDKEYQ